MNDPGKSMIEFLSLRARYLRDPLSVRIGRLAANLARVASFSRDPRHEKVVARLIEECRRFIEWTVSDARPDKQDLLVNCQRQLDQWESDWDEIWRDDKRRRAVANAARVWSERLLETSGLLDVSSSETFKDEKFNDASLRRARPSNHGH